MRVIGGKFRSRVLEAPDGMGTRPTADRLRETLFNVLTQGAVDRVEGRAFLDLYAGSGAVGIEALSRGALAFIERDDTLIAFTGVQQCDILFGFFLGRIGMLDVEFLAFDFPKCLLKYSK